MKRVIQLPAVLLMSIGFAVAQSSGSIPDAATRAVPQLINYSGTLNDSHGMSLSEPAGVTFLIFSQPQGGEAVWVETQNIHPDKTGHFSAVLGATTQGLPANLFTTDEPRWLEIQVPGQAPQARALLVAVPYALKAVDAETLGGLPPSAFMLTKDKTTAASEASKSASAAVQPSTSASPASTSSTVSVGLTAPGSDFKVTGSPVKGTGTLALNWTTPPTSSNVANAIVKRDKFGNFSTNGVSVSGSLVVNGTSTFEYPIFAEQALVVGNTTSKGLRLRDNGAGVDMESIGVPLYLNWIANQPIALGNPVGIGTAAPQAELNLNLGGTASGDDLLIGNSSTKGLRMRDNGEGLDLESIGAPLYVNYVTQQDVNLNPNGGLVNIGTNPPPNETLCDSSFIHCVYLPALLNVGALNKGGGAYTSAYFTNDVAIDGNLLVHGSKNFQIDHPLDPENKYLEHAAIESSEVLNQYSGNVVLDSSGEGIVEFPDWFAAINVDFRYQLTAVGAPGPGLYVAKEIVDRSFTIAGGMPGMKVSWQVTARRNDAYMQAHPFVVEKEKPAGAHGRSTHSDLDGAQPAAGPVAFAKP